MTDNDLMPFGTHKDKPMIKVPASYLMWFWEYGNGWSNVRAYIRDNLEILQKEVEQNNKFKKNETY